MLLDALARRYAFFPREELREIFRRHGALAAEVLGDAARPDDLGENFGAGLYEREVRYLVRHEWARSAEDVLWRRTKTGLRMSKAQRERLADRMGA
jgi:glycerol-3-phosphate dehydrogenase